MTAPSDQILSELRHLLSKMSDGGCVGPSVYDTARALHFSGVVAGNHEACDWLIAQQQPDGGWGSSDFPLFRHAPTWAAFLALQRAGSFPGAADAVQAAEQFLRHQPDPYEHAVPEDAPIGAELILPQLLGEATRSKGLNLPRHRALVRLRQSRLAKVHTLAALPSGHPLLHSWEAWGSSPAMASPDEHGSIGISPAATAAWRAQASAQASSPELLRRADAYLHAASLATASGLDNILPNVWPIDIFEPCWSLFSLHLGGLLAHPALAQAVRRIVARLEACMSTNGLGPASHFAADADDTAVALCVLNLVGRVPGAHALRQFKIGEVFVTFPGERNASVSTNIHALHALRLAGQTAAATSAFVDANRNPQGVWDNEKWHASWLYPTSHAVAALAQGAPKWRDERVLVALLKAQRDDGGWGAGSGSTFEETAYALFALRVLDERETPTARARAGQAVARALEWMLAHYVANTSPYTALWIGKELYCPTRVVRVAELVGLWLALSWGSKPEHRNED
ncbi:MULTISPECIES: prenyltransferase/squalene oxidase repeat-containing protein [Rhizobium]|uniref:Squalene cyclase C-terminal domain-containing protein n=2 Tax=Rhizobium TaxID=379 RepID=A0A120FLI7_9HYPH|nr:MULTISPECIES: prenyltransferase/squalene oxidase repeat-containing protein [Rhizobium]KWV52327.1 hypothetical protein AS026_04980 [Rhizobium altiplani]CCM80364.1 putative Terpenoid cylases / protein prenyltransferase alpha-alpha toroid [Rhizobium mesoamericanum STM3625]